MLVMMMRLLREMGVSGVIRVYHHPVHQFLLVFSCIVWNMVEIVFTHL